MKTKIILLFIVLMIPMLLFAQKGKWLRKGSNASYPQKMIEYFTKSIELEDFNATAYYCRGYVYLLIEQYNNAIADFDSSIEIEPDPASYFYRGNAYADLEQYELAIVDYTNVIENSPQISDAYYSRSISYWYLDKYESALLDCEKVIELDPKYAVAYFIRGTILLELGEYVLAIKDLSKAIELDPKISEAYYNRHIAYECLLLYEKDIED